MKTFVCTIRVTQRLSVSLFLPPPAGHVPSSLGVILRTTDKTVWANEFECKLLENHSSLLFNQSMFFFLFFFLRLSRSVFSFTAIELTCLIESISTNNPRIEWKKIKNGIPSYVYFQNKIAGKPLGNSLFWKLHQPVRAHYFKGMSRDLEALLNEWYLKRTWHWGLFFTLRMWMSNCNVFFSLKKGTWSTELSSESLPTSWSSTPLGQTLQSTAARWLPSMIKGTLMRSLLVLQWEVRLGGTFLRYYITDWSVIGWDFIWVKQKTMHFRNIRFSYFSFHSFSFRRNITLM